MPFVQTTREKMDTLGVAALNLTLDFDEAQVLKINQDYLRNTLDVSLKSVIINFIVNRVRFRGFIVSTVWTFTFQLEQIEIKYTDEAPEKTKEECCPGAPYMSFSTRPGLSITVINRQKCTGFLSKTIKLSDGDTAANISTRIAKDNKLIKGTNVLLNVRPPTVETWIFSYHQFAEICNLVLVYRSRFRSSVSLRRSCTRT